MVFVKLIYLTALVLGCGYAVARGGAAERWGAAIVAGGMVLSNAAAFRSVHPFVATDMALFLTDALEAACLIVLASVANRFWPLWIAMFQLDTVFLHVVMFAHATPPFSYAMALWLFAVPLPILVGLGTFRHRQRLSHEERPQPQ